MSRPGAAAVPAPAAPRSELDAFLDYYEKIRGRTTRVVDCIPAEKVDWTWRPGKFTLGDIVRHIAAIERYMFAENVQGKPSRYPGHGPELADGLPAVRAFFEKTHAESMAIFRGLTPEHYASGKSQTPAGTPITTSKWMRSMVEHEIHHRGQLYVYLSMLDIPTPPIYGLTSEQVKERSVSD